jgi:hypothetical protein
MLNVELESTGTLAMTQGDILISELQAHPSLFHHHPSMPQLPSPCLFIMPLPPSQETFGPYDFAAEFFRGFDFTAKFDFGDFGLDFAYPRLAKLAHLTTPTKDVSVDGTPGQQSYRHWQRSKICM